MRSRRIVRKRRAVRKRAPARRRLQSKGYDITGGTYKSAFTRAAVAAGAYGLGKLAYTKGRRGRNIPMVKQKGLKLQRDDGTSGGYSQWTQRYQQSTFGRLTTRKINKLSNDTLIFRHQNIGPFNDYGKRFMYNATNATTWFTPLILFELNSVNNHINGTQTFMNPVHQMTQAIATGHIAWDSIAGQSTDGTSLITNWIPEKSSHISTAVSTSPMDQSIHKWSSLDLELWGQTTKPTMYTIYLCQFSEDVLPETVFAANVGSYATITNQNAIEFWQSMIKRYTYSPLAKIDDGWGKKKIKIMKQYKINIDPTASYENDPDPHVKTMKLFYRFNRKCNFEWKYSNAQGQSVANMNDADWQQEDGENQCQVHPNARLFVMLRASNFVRTTTDAATNANSPSISWVMRSCHLVTP